MEEPLWRMKDSKLEDLLLFLRRFLNQELRGHSVLLVLPNDPDCAKEVAKLFAALGYSGDKSVQVSIVRYVRSFWGRQLRGVEIKCDRWLDMPKVVVNTDLFLKAFLG